MLSSLQQGSPVYIIDKTKGINFIVGEVVNRTEPTVDYSNPQYGVGCTFFDLTVKVESETYELKHLNSTLTLANNGNIIVSETKESLIPLVESTIQNSKKQIDPVNIEYHTNIVSSGENILKQLNPSFAKEKERDIRIQSLEDKVGTIDDKLDKILNLVNSK